MTTPQIQLIGDLITCLYDFATGKDLDDLVGHHQELFFSLVTDNTTGADDKQFHCPVQCFIAAYSYNEDDTFKLPAGMTPMVRLG